MINHKHYILYQLVAIPILLLLFSSGAFAASLSVKEWIAQKGDWKEFTKSEKVIKIEGRVSTISKDQLRLQKCRLTFRSESGRPFKRPQRKYFNVHVTGYLKIHKGSLEFMVTRMFTAPTDIGEFEIRSKKITKADPNQWNQLADWAENRADFYTDDQLEQQALGARLKGIMIQRSLLKVGDFEGLEQLAVKLIELKLDVRLQKEYQHSAYRYRWDVTKKKDEKVQKEFLEKLKENFPGCETPLDKPDEKLQSRYLASPHETYHASDDITRIKLHRLFYREVQFPILTKNADENPREGYLIAEKIDQLIPEEKAFAEQLREKELTYRIKHISTANRKQLSSLKQKLIDRKQLQQAELIENSWLAAREGELRKEGPTGLVRAARLYLEIKKDKQTGTQLLLEAFKKNNKTQGVAEELTKLGYHYHQKKWLTAAEYKNRKIDPIQQAMQNGNIIVGMTREQVLKTLTPVSKFRMVSANGVTEIWVFGEPHETRITAHLLQPDRKSSSAKVIKVIEIQPR